MIRLDKKGFTLIEIMIVVAIIALLAAIAIPNVVRARLNANEGAAMAAMRTIYTTCESFRAVQTPPAYPTSLSNLSTATPPYIGANFTEAGTVQGYVYGVVDTSNNSTIAAWCYPATAGTTGNRSFGIVEDGILRATTGAIVAEPTYAAIAGWTAVAGF